MWLQNTTSQNRFTITAIVYVALLLDNILLTVIVPILPDYLATIVDNRTYISMPQSVVYKNFDLHYVPTILSKHPIPGKSLVNFSLVVQQLPVASDGEHSQKQNIDISPTSSTSYKMLENENGSIGILLAVKALVQLFCNPFVGAISNRIGYRIPIVVGTFCLLISSLVFAIGETYATLLIARALQGIGSACIGVCGMSLVAQLYPEDDRRSKVMGVVLGSVALGVLLGYPIGGILYDFVGKSAPFYILSAIIVGSLVVQFIFMDLISRPEVIIEFDRPRWQPILQNRLIIAIVIAIWLSTSTLAMLEPCLPIWLLENLHPKKWQLGTVFIPDSIGYFIGTNFFGTYAYRIGQIKVSCLSLMMVGVSCIMIPSATTVYRLLLPHFGLGLGIGIVDVALVPLLASSVDASLGDDDSTSSDTMTSYGTVYAIQQTSVSLAYCLAPLLGGELAQAIGFPWLMRFVGLINFLYGPILMYYYTRLRSRINIDKSNQMLLTASTAEGPTDYKRLYNTNE